MSLIVSQSAISRPTVVVTNGYLNDPISFNPNVAFEPESVLRDLGSVPVIDRDQSGAAMVDINKLEAQIYPAEMTSVVFRRNDVERIIDKQFNQLV